MAAPSNVAVKPGGHLFFSAGGRYNIEGAANGERARAMERRLAQNFRLIATRLGSHDDVGNDYDHNNKDGIASSTTTTTV